MAQQLTMQQQRLAAGQQRPRSFARPSLARPAPCRAPSSCSRAPRHAICAAGKLDEVSLFSDSSMVSAGAASTSAAKAAAGVEDVELKSKLGLDYAPLAAYLKEGDFRKADDETRALLIKMAGTGAVARGWVYFSEVKSIPVEDLQTVDALWKAGSKGKFGYSIQREVFIQNARRWPKFFKQIDWTVGENNIYRKWPAEFIYSMDAVKGHLPLTNALRGTQLFEALLQHPAFQPVAGPAGAKGSSIEERSKAAGANTLKF